MILPGVGIEPTSKTWLHLHDIIKKSQMKLKGPRRAIVARMTPDKEK